MKNMKKCVIILIVTFCVYIIFRELYNYNLEGYSSSIPYGGSNLGSINVVCENKAKPGSGSFITNASGLGGGSGLDGSGGDSGSGGSGSGGSGLGGSGGDRVPIPTYATGCPIGWTSGGRVVQLGRKAGRQWVGSVCDSSACFFEENGLSWCSTPADAVAYARDPTFANAIAEAEAASTGAPSTGAPSPSVEGFSCGGGDWVPWRYGTGWKFLSKAKQCGLWNSAEWNNEYASTFSCTGDSYYKDVNGISRCVGKNLVPLEKRTNVFNKCNPNAVSVMGPGDFRNPTAPPPPPTASPSPSTGAPSTGAPSTGAPSTGAPSTSAPSTGAPSTSAPSHACNNSPIPADVPLVGWWYYPLGISPPLNNCEAADCGENPLGYDPGDMGSCGGKEGCDPVSQAKLLGLPLTPSPTTGLIGNTTFNLASGAVPGDGAEWTCTASTGTGVLQPLPIADGVTPPPYNVLNIGGWGPSATVPSKWTAAAATEVTSNMTKIKSYCAKAGYNIISLDIEGINITPDSAEAFGVAINTVCCSARNNGLGIILTLPGYGVKSDYGGMEWFKYVKPNNVDRLCLMFYNKSRDTEGYRDGAGTMHSNYTASKVKATLKDAGWYVLATKPSPGAEWTPEKFILGVSCATFNCGGLLTNPWIKANFKGGLSVWRRKNIPVGEKGAGRQLLGGAANTYQTIVPWNPSAPECPYPLPTKAGYKCGPVDNWAEAKNGAPCGPGGTASHPYPCPTVPSGVKQKCWGVGK